MASDGARSRGPDRGKRRGGVRSLSLVFAPFCVCSEHRDRFLISSPTLFLKRYRSTTQSKELACLLPVP